MKNLKFVVFLTFLFALTFFIENKAIASQNFEFYYQTVTKIEDIGTLKQDGDKWYNKIGKAVKQGINDIKEAWNEGVTNSNIHKTGEQKWYSGETKNLVYTVNRVKINSREELIAAIGVPESDMTEGQKALLDCYDMAYSKAIDERSQYSYRDPIRVVFTDTADTDWSYTDANGNTQTVPEYTYQHDFWSWSNGNTIHMASHNYDSAYARDKVKSTFLHEYCHAIDKTNSEWIKPYGKDGTHMYNNGSSEMTKDKVAFVEGWAEYNEMIEFPDRANYYLNGIATICIELSAKEAAKKNLDPAKEGSNGEGGWFKNGNSTYVMVSASDLTAKELWKCEGFNCAALYKLATELDNGKQKVYDAFIKSRGKAGRDIRTFVKELCKQNPNDIAAIGRILDDLTMGKMTDKEFKKFIGTSKEAKAFLKERAAGYPNDKKAEASEDKTNVVSEASEVNEASETSEETAPELSGTSEEEGNVFNIK